jgi:hypothetical protein
MRMIIAAIALAAVLAPPTFAKYYNMAPDQVTGTVHNPPARSFGKEYIGRDPDERIQFELGRDPAVDR